MQEQMKKVLEQAARLQQLVPQAVLVGGSAASVYAEHRYSLDHDHVITDLEEKFDLILEALEREGDWVTRQLSEPKPKDFRSIKELPNYKGTLDKWKDWNFIAETCKAVAKKVMENNNA